MNEITNDQVGDPVIDPSGQTVAILREVRNGDPFVEPVPDLDTALRAAFGWGGDDRELYRLDGSYIDSVQSGSVRITDPR